MIIRFSKHERLESQQTISYTQTSEYSRSSELKVSDMPHFLGAQAPQDAFASRIYLKAFFLFSIHWRSMW